VQFNPYLKCQAAALLLPRRRRPAALLLSATAECELSAATATNSPLAVLSYLHCTVSKFAANETGSVLISVAVTYRKVEINFIVYC
jgi:hypothetical protein